MRHIFRWIGPNNGRSIPTRNRADIEWAQAAHADSDVVPRLLKVLWVWSGYRILRRTRVHYRSASSLDNPIVAARALPPPQEHGQQQHCCEVGGDNNPVQGLKVGTHEVRLSLVALTSFQTGA